MHRNSPRFLLSLLSFIFLFGLANAQICCNAMTSPGCKPTSVAYNIDPATAISLALLALSVSFDVIAIAYIIGKLVPGTGLSGWVKGEFTEVIKTMVIIAAIFTVMIFMGSVANVLAGPEIANAQANGVKIVSTAGANGYTLLSDQMNNLANTAEFFLYSTYCGVPLNSPQSIGGAITNLNNFALQLGILKSLVVGFYLPIPIPIEGVPAFGFGAEYGYYQNDFIFGPFTGPNKSFLNDAYSLLISPVGLATVAQYILLPVLVGMGVIVLIPIGLIFRAFPFVRNIGGTMIGIGVGLSLIYPSLLIVFNEPVLNALNSAIPAAVPTNGGFNWFTTLLNNAFNDGYNTGFYDISSIYGPLAVITQYSVFLLTILITYVFDLILGLALAKGVAQLLGGRIRTSLGGKYHI